MHFSALVVVMNNKIRIFCPTKITLYTVKHRTGVGVRFRGLCLGLVDRVSFIIVRMFGGGLRLGVRDRVSFGVSVIGWVIGLAFI